MPLRLLFVALVTAGLTAWAAPARAQNDWQFPDPYFGALQHRSAGTPQAERKYRAEIAPQQPHRLHEHRSLPEKPPRPRWSRQRSRARAG